MPRPGDPVRNPVCERLTPAGTEPGPNLAAVDADRVRIDVPARRDVRRLPELLEVAREVRGDVLVLNDRDHVFLACPGVAGPVHRAGPDTLAVSDDVLVVHEVGFPGDSLGLDRELLDQIRNALRRRGDR